MTLGSALQQIVIGVVAAAVFTAIGFLVRRYWDKLPYRRLARLLHPIGQTGEEVIFVFPLREEAPAAILPRTSTEDMAAINNIVGSLAIIGWKGPVRVRDTERLGASDKQKDVVAICSPKTNTFTAEVFDKILKEQGLDFYSFQEVGGNSGRWEIVRKTAHFPSDSYEQEKEVRQKGDVVAEGRYEDVAVLAKVTNPWNARSKVLLVSGVRGFGTWGAAEFLRKNASELYAKKGKPKNGNFAALIEVTYENCDVSTRAYEVIDLP